MHIFHKLSNPRKLKTRKIPSDLDRFELQRINILLNLGYNISFDLLEYTCMKCEKKKYKYDNSFTYSKDKDWFKGIPYI